MTESSEKKEAVSEKMELSKKKQILSEETACECSLGLNHDQALKLEVCRMLIPHYRDVASLRRMTSDIVQLIKE